MTAKPQPMAGHSEAPDDLIAELAKLMAQDAQDTPPPPKPASPSPFTVRIPGEAANAQAPRREETVRIPQTSPVEQAPPQAAAFAGEPVRSEATAGQPGDAQNGFGFAPESGSRREARPVAAPAPVPPDSPAAPVPAPDPAPVEHDSIADLIAAELAMDSQPAPAAPRQAAPPNQLVSQAPADSSPARPAPNPNAGWTPVNVAPNPGGQDRPSAPQLRSVNLQPAPRPEPVAPDKFKVPPVFGLGTNASSTTAAADAAAPQPVRVEPTPAPVEENLAREPARPAPSQPTVPQDSVGLDPIDEIENLIGRAVRVDLDKPQAPSPEARPAPRSLATPQLPKQSAPAARGISSADEAILAAAHASGAEIGWVEAPEKAAPEPRRKREKRQRPVRSMGFSRAVAGPLIAVTLLLAAGFGLYWVLGLSGGESGPAPLLTADATPVKETPAVQPEPAADEQSIVFNEINGVVPGAEEQLVSRDQADVNEVTQVATTPDVSSEGLANRKVRTVTVRPDGTIVSGDNSLAGSTILPVDRPNVPAVPGAQTASPELLANAGAGSALPSATGAPAEPAVPAPDAAATGAPATDTMPAAVPGETTAALPDPAAPAPATPEPAAPAAPVVTPGATVPAVDTAGNPLPGKTTVIPLQRPSSFAQTPLAAAEPAAPVDAVAEPAAADLGQLPPPPGGQPSTTVPGATEVAALPNDAPAYVQLASQRTEDEARATAQRLVTRFGPLFGGANMEVQRVDLGSRGIFYRVRVPANSMQEAANICTNVKAAGGDCFTM